MNRGQETQGSGSASSALGFAARARHDGPRTPSIPRAVSAHAPGGPGSAIGCAISRRTETWSLIRGLTTSRHPLH
eukprot:7095675-Alexandrium_andersonii.AAC.1